MKKVKLFRKGQYAKWDPRRKKDILFDCYWIRRYGQGPFKIHNIHRVDHSKQVLVIITEYGLVGLSDYWLVPA